MPPVTRRWRGRTWSVTEPISGALERAWPFRAALFGQAHGPLAFWTQVLLRPAVIEVADQRRAVGILKRHVRVRQSQRSGTAHIGRPRIERDCQVADLGVEGRLSRQRVWYLLGANLQQPPLSRHCTTKPEHTRPVALSLITLNSDRLAGLSLIRPVQKVSSQSIMSTVAAMFGAVGLACGRCLHVVEQLL